MTVVLLRGLAVFMLLIVATSVMMDVMKMDLGTVNFWQKHNVFFLIFITIFPRLTLIFSSVATGGIFWWLGFIFVPRILVACLATVTYFNTNPVLVTISWLVAFGGEIFEKRSLSNSRFVIKTYRTPHPKGMQDYQEELRPHSTIKKDDAIEAEFTKES